MSGNFNMTFVDDAERQMFLEAQQKTIVEQSRKITQLEVEIRELKSKLADKAQTLPALSSHSGPTMVNDEESIARIELKKLRDVALSRELTMEEARKVEIYFKILNQMSTKPKQAVIDTKKLPSDQLLASLGSSLNDETE